jgi:hypothetical protein
MEKIKKEYIYFQNAFSLFLVKSVSRIRIAANLTATAIKIGFKFAYVYPCEKAERDKCYAEFCDQLFKSLNKGIK